eukprot:7380210-Prymnesium_polylepis.2
MPRSLWIGSTPAKAPRSRRSCSGCKSRTDPWCWSRGAAPSRASIGRRPTPTCSSCACSRRAPPRAAALAAPPGAAGGAARRVAPTRPPACRRRATATKSWS